MVVTENTTSSQKGWYMTELEYKLMQENTELRKSLAEYEARVQFANSRIAELLTDNQTKEDKIKDVTDKTVELLKRWSEFEQAIDQTFDQVIARTLGDEDDANI